MKSLPFAAAFAALGLAAAAPAAHAASSFALAYRVERTATANLSLTACLETAKATSAALGYAPAMENRYPGQLMVFASGPAGGNHSLIVYCIAVDQKTAFVVQALDYTQPNSPDANRVADRVHAALMAAAK